VRGDVDNRAAVLGDRERERGRGLALVVVVGGQADLVRAGVRDAARQGLVGAPFGVPPRHRVAEHRDRHPRAAAEGGWSAGTQEVGGVHAVQPLVEGDRRAPRMDRAARHVLGCRAAAVPGDVVRTEVAAVEGLDGHARRGDGVDPGHDLAPAPLVTSTPVLVLVSGRLPAPGAAGFGAARQRRVPGVGEDSHGHAGHRHADRTGGGRGPQAFGNGGGDACQPVMRLRPGPRRDAAAVSPVQLEHRGARGGRHAGEQTGDPARVRGPDRRAHRQGRAGGGDPAGRGDSPVPLVEDAPHPQPVAPDRHVHLEPRTGAHETDPSPRLRRRSD